MEYVDDLVDKFLVDVHLLASNVRQRLYIVHVEEGVPATVELIVDFEQPSVHVQVVRDQLRQL